MTFTVVARPHQLPVVFDELGCEAYVPVYPNGETLDDSPVHVTVSGTSEMMAPWSLGTFSIRKSCPAWTHLSSDGLWRSVEFAVRIAIVGLMPATILLYAYDNGNGPWKSTSIIIIGSIVSFLLRCETIGSYLAYVGTMLRASVIWVPILVVATRIQLYNHIAASFVVFAAVNLLAATFMEGHKQPS